MASQTHHQTGPKRAATGRKEQAHQAGILLKVQVNQTAPDHQKNILVKLPAKKGLFHAEEKAAMISLQAASAAGLVKKNQLVQEAGHIPAVRQKGAAAKGNHFLKAGHTPAELPITIQDQAKASAAKEQVIKKRPFHAADQQVHLAMTGLRRVLVVKGQAIRSLSHRAESQQVRSATTGLRKVSVAKEQATRSLSRHAESQPGLAIRNSAINHPAGVDLKKHSATSHSTATVQNVQVLNLKRQSSKRP